MPRTFTVDVAQEDIDKAAANVNRGTGRTCVCPIANALSRILGVACSVGFRTARISGKDAHTIYFDAFQAINVTVLDDQHWYAVKPFSFTATVED